MMAAIRTGVRSWSPRAWSGLVAQGRGGFRTRRLVGLMSGFGVRVTQPLRPIVLGYVQPVLPEIEPVARAAWDPAFG